MIEAAIGCGGNLGDPGDGITRALTRLADDAGLTIYSQDDPAFPPQIGGVIDDRDLDVRKPRGVTIDNVVVDDEPLRRRWAP